MLVNSLCLLVLIAVAGTENPCDNFYAYSCSKWLAETHKPSFEPIWNPWIAASHNIKRRLSKILTRRHAPSLAKPHLFYESCLNIVNHENRYLRQLIALVGDLGGWPLSDHHWRSDGYDWLRQLARVTRLGIHPILKIHNDLDYKDPTKFSIYIEPGDLIFPEHILTGVGHGTELEVYEKWIFETAAHVYPNVSEILDRREVREIVKFEVHLAKIMNVKRYNERKTIKDLYKVTPGGWLPAIKHIFGGFTGINYDTVVNVKHYTYLKNLVLLIKQTGDKIVADYLIWSVIKDLSRDTTHHMRNLNFLIDQAILGVQDDLSREHECIDKVIKYFSPLLVPPYLKSYVNPRTFPKISHMVNSIKEEFVSALLNSKWLSKKGKVLTATKVKNIRLHLGYPREILKYRDVEITPNHFANIIRLKNYETRRKKKSTILWPSSPFDVNAYYSILQNSIFIPLGLFERPFFDYDRDDTLNYGALGSLIGHEISHSLDPVGILADSSGRIGKWLPEDDLLRYKNRTICFASDNTLVEDIADSNGIRISLGALKNPKRRDFFLSFAQMWCEISSSTDIFTGEEHAHVASRVQNLIRNENFRETFKCNGSSCSLW